MWESKRKHMNFFYYTTATSHNNNCNCQFWNRYSWLYWMTVTRTKNSVLSIPSLLFVQSLCVCITFFVVLMGVTFQRRYNLLYAISVLVVEIVFSTPMVLQLVRSMGGVSLLCIPFLSSRNGRPEILYNVPRI